LLGRPGGLRNSRTTFIFVCFIYAYRHCQWPSHLGSTVLGAPVTTGKVL
jgi:hypothetical protein